MLNLNVRKILLKLSKTRCIGEHEHVEETECYVIKSGKGVVIDNGKKIVISAGDVVITRNGDVHSVINTENEDLEILAFIVLN